MESPGKSIANRNLKDRVKKKGVIIEMRIILSQPPFLQKTVNVLNRKILPAISNGTRPVNIRV